jgi:hypothetical protein
MQSLDRAQLQQFREQVTLKLPSSFHASTFLPLLIILVPLIAFLGWYVYREWQMKRDFQRYWNSKPAPGNNPKPPRQAAAPRRRPNWIQAQKQQAGHHS